MAGPGGTGQGRTGQGRTWLGRAGQGYKTKKGDKMETKKYPAWKNAIEIVLQRFDNEGYGIMFSDEEILLMLELEKPKVGTYDTFQKFNLEKLSQLEGLKKALLEEQNLCLENVKGNGYMLMHPDDQVMKTSQKYYRHARKKMNKMVSILTYCDNDALSQEGKQKQINQLGKAAFIRAAMNKRKFIADVKQIV